MVSSTSPRLADLMRIRFLLPITSVPFSIRKRIGVPMKMPRCCSQMRCGVRMLLEITKPEAILNELNIQSTVIVFGGVNVVSGEAAQQRIDQAKDALASDPSSKRLKREVFRAEQLMALSHFYDDARQFAKLVSSQPAADGRRHVIVTGGGPGIWRRRIGEPLMWEVARSG